MADAVTLWDIGWTRLPRSSIGWAVVLVAADDGLGIVRDAHEAVGKPVSLGDFGVGVDRKDSTEEEQEAAMGRRNDIYETNYDTLVRTDGNAALFWQLEPRNPDTGNLSYKDDPAGQPKAVYYPEDEETVDIIEAFTQRMQKKSVGQV